MSKFILNLMGYLLSFMLGSIFTTYYVDYMVSHPTPTHKENKIKISKTKSQLAELSNAFEASNLLKEVIIRPTHNTLELYNKNETKENSKIIVGTTVSKKYFITSNKPIVKNTIQTNNLSKFSNLKTLPFIPNRPDAKARSPGYFYNGTNLNLRIKIINFQSNNSKMLKKDKQHVTAILKLLFAGKKSFKIKDDGTIIIKKHWYSRKKVITSIKEIINYTIPKSMVNISKDLAENYQQAITVIDQNELDLLILTAYNHFGNFCTEVGYQGKLLNFDLEMAPLQYFIYRHRTIWDEKISNMRQLNLNVLVSKWLPKNKKYNTTEKLKMLPTRMSYSIQDILNTNAYNLKNVGVCLTGIPETDAALPKVMRLTENIDLI